MNIGNTSTIPTRNTNYFNYLIYEWFVRYNPLYFVSAACFIFGVFLLSEGMRNINWIDGQIMLTGVIEFYQLLLLAGSFILYRCMSQTRPAVILAIMNICFFFDCTYQTEHLSSVENIGDFLTVLWIAIFIVKFKLLTWIFRLKIPPVGFIAPVLAAIGIAAAPHFLYNPTINASFIHLAMTWYGVGLAVLVLCFRPDVICSAELKGFSKTVLRRASKSAWMIWCGFYLFHLISWIRFFDIPITLANVAPAFIVLAFVSKREEVTWVGCMLTVMSSLADSSFFWVNAMLTGSVFVFTGWKQRQPRLFLGAIISMHVALAATGWQGGPFPEPAPWVHVFTGICLIATGIGYRLFSAAVVALIWILTYWKPRGPEDIMDWGALFIAIAFATLATGIFLSWKYRFWPAQAGSGHNPSPTKIPKNVPSANKPLQAKGSGASRKGMAKDLNGFCPYCSFQLNAGKSKCDKCGKTFY